jgi:hypothetical protein
MLAFGVVSLFFSALLASAQTANGPTDKDPIFITSPVESTTGLHTGKVKKFLPLFASTVCCVV